MTRWPLVILTVVLLVGCATPAYVCYGVKDADGDPALYCRPVVKK